MPRKSELPKRPRDVNQLAAMIGRIAVKEVEDSKPEAVNPAAKKRGDARAAKLSKQRRVEIAKKAAKARWSRKSK